MSADGICLRSTVSRNQFWDRLPLEMAVEIYRFLPMNDKHNMSLTCKFWSAAFRDPRTWRYSHFVFTGKRSSTRDIPDKVLSLLQYVTIDCSLPRRYLSDKYIMEKTMRLVTFVVGLKKSKNTTLQTLAILEMKDLGNHVIGSRLHNHLITLLALQTKLSRLSLFNGGLTTAQGLKLLTAAGENSARSIKYLNVHNFSKETSRFPPVLTFAQLCGSFTNVTELSLNYGFMSDNLLNNVSGTLKLIIVWVNNSASDHKYSENGWNALVSKCSGLKAEYHVRGYMNISLVLLPAIPLATIHWFSREGASEKRLRLNQIINTCKNGLEHLHVDAGRNFLSKSDVEAVAERCPLLQTFSINGISMIN